MSSLEVVMDEERYSGAGLMDFHAYVTRASIVILEVSWKETSGQA